MVGTEDWCLLKRGVCLRGVSVKRESTVLYTSVTFQSSIIQTYNQFVALKIQSVVNWYLFLQFVSQAYTILSD